VEEHEGDDDEEEETSNANVEEASEAEKAFYAHQFKQAMFHSFIDGRDSGFDYIKVDQDSDLDDLEAEARDAQEKYFDTDYESGKIIYFL